MIREQHQHFDNVDANGLHRVNFFIDAHRTDLRREGGARTARHDDRRHQHAHFAQGNDAQPVDGQKFGAELFQLLDALIGDHHTDQEGEQADNRQGVDAGLFHLMDQSGETQIGLGRSEGFQRLDRDAAQITQHAPALLTRMHSGLADAIEPVAEEAPPPHPDRRCLMLLVQRLQQWGIAVGQIEGADGLAGGFQRPLGAQQEPGSGAVKLLDAATVDRHTGGAPRLQGAQLGIQPGAFPDGPGASHRQNRAVPVLPEPGLRRGRNIFYAGHPTGRVESAARLPLWHRNDKPSRPPKVPKVPETWPPRTPPPAFVAPRRLQTQQRHCP